MVLYNSKGKGNGQAFPSEFNKLKTYGDRLIELAEKGDWLEVAREENNWIERIQTFIEKVGKEVEQSTLLEHLKVIYEQNRVLLESCASGKDAILTKAQEARAAEEAAMAYRGATPAV